MFKDILFGISADPDLVSSFSLQFIKETLPYKLSVVLTKSLVPQDHMYSGDKGIVKVPNPIGGQEEYTFVVLNGAKEDC